MSLYRHIARFQPQAIRAKKQTFSNLLLPLPAKRSGEGWGEGCVPVNLAADTEACLSLRAADTTEHYTTLLLNALSMVE
jgi:hypothetical protein